MNLSYKIALGVTLLAILWMASGLFKPEHSATEHQVLAPKAETIGGVSVKIEEMSAEQYSPRVVVNGRTEASKTVTVRAEVDGRITALEVSRGSIVKKGQVLARIDVRDRRERVTEAEQKLKQAEVEHEAASVLQSEGFNSKIRLAQKRAELESARAQLKLAQTDLANTELRAPFDGVVSDRSIEAGDYVKGGDAIVTVVILDPLEIEGFMSETDVVHVKLGTEAEIVLPDGKKITGKIKFVAPVADERSRTFPVELVAANPEGIIAGLTASIAIPLEPVPAYRIASSSLALDAGGRVGVKIVDSEGKVRFMPVRVLSDVGGQIWVAGLPDTVRLITAGQAFVVEGQVVQ